MAKKKRKPRRLSKWRIVVYSAAGFLAIGYIPAAMLGDFRISMVAAMIGVIPFGAKTTVVRTGLIRGALLGVTAGAAMVVGLVHFQIRRQSIVTDKLAAICVLSTTAACALICALFAHLADRRRQHADRQWE